MCLISLYEWILHFSNSSFSISSIIVNISPIIYGSKNDETYKNCVTRNDKLIMFDVNVIIITMFDFFTNHVVLEGDYSLS